MERFKLDIENRGSNKNIIGLSFFYFKPLEALLLITIINSKNQWWFSIHDIMRPLYEVRITSTY